MKFSLFSMTINLIREKLPYRDMYPTHIEDSSFYSLLNFHKLRAIEFEHKQLMKFDR